MKLFNFSDKLADYPCLNKFTKNMLLITCENILHEIIGGSTYEIDFDNISRETDPINSPVSVY